MSTRSAAAIVAVMSAITFTDARAQNFIPRGPELNFVKPGGSVLTCSTDAVFTNATLHWIHDADGVIKSVAIRGTTFTEVKFNFPKGNDKD